MRGAATTSGMYRKIMQTRAANEKARAAEDRRRAADPLEEAKRYLRTLDYNVYAESIRPGRHASRKFVCGSRLLSRRELMAFAAETRQRRQELCCASR